MPRRPAPVYGVRNRQHDDEDADDPAVEGKPAAPQGVIEALVDIVASVIVSPMLPGEIQGPDAPGTLAGRHAIPSEHARAIAT